MTVKVYDRSGDWWLFESAHRVVSEDGCLTIYREDGSVAGGFNAASWTHHESNRDQIHKVSAVVPILRGYVVDHRLLATDALKRECKALELNVVSIDYVGESSGSDDLSGYTVHTYEAIAKTRLTEAVDR